MWFRRDGNIDAVLRWTSATFPVSVSWYSLIDHQSEEIRLSAFGGQCLGELANLESMVYERGRSGSAGYKVKMSAVPIHTAIPMGYGSIFLLF
jgi:hypothetical protein